MRIYSFTLVLTLLLTPKMGLCQLWDIEHVQGSQFVEFHKALNSADSMFFYGQYRDALISYLVAFQIQEVTDHLSLVKAAISAKRLGLPDMPSTFVARVAYPEHVNFLSLGAKELKFLKKSGLLSELKEIRNYDLMPQDSSPLTGYYIAEFEKQIDKAPVSTGSISHYERKELNHITIEFLEVIRYDSLFYSALYNANSKGALLRVLSKLLSAESEELKLQIASILKQLLCRNLISPDEYAIAIDLHLLEIGEKPYYFSVFQFVYEHILTNWNTINKRRENIGMKSLYSLEFVRVNNSFMVKQIW